MPVYGPPATEMQMSDRTCASAARDRRGNVPFGMQGPSRAESFPNVMRAVFSCGMSVFSGISGRLAAQKGQRQAQRPLIKRGIFACTDAAEQGSARRAAGKNAENGRRSARKRGDATLQILCISKLRAPHAPLYAPVCIARGGTEQGVFGEAGREKDVFLSVKKSPSRFLFIFSRKERRGKEKRKAAFRRFFCARTRGRKQKKEPFQYDMP